MFKNKRKLTKGNRKKEKVFGFVFVFVFCCFLLFFFDNRIQKNIQKINIYIHGFEAPKKI